jgi:hypothetical protein
MNWVFHASNLHKTGKCIKPELRLLLGLLP